MESRYNMRGKKISMIGGIVMFLLKLPFRVAALPLLVLLLAVRFASALLTGLSSVVTNALGTAAVLAAAGIWMFKLGTDQDAYKMIGFAINHRPQNGQVIYSVSDDYTATGDNVKAISLDGDYLMNEKEYASVRNEVDEILNKNFRLKG